MQIISYIRFNYCIAFLIMLIIMGKTVSHLGGGVGIKQVSLKENGGPLHVL